MKKYTLVKFQTVYQHGLVLDMMPVPGLFLWHNEEDGRHLYVLDKTRPFVDSLVDAKSLVQTSSNTLFAHFNKEAAVAIIEVDCNDKDITGFSKIFKLDKKLNWKEFPISDSELTGDALKDINAIYHQNSQCDLRM